MLVRHLRAALVVVCLGSPTLSAWADEEARLLRRPSISGEAIAFSHAGELWITSREGGSARRLTWTPAVETDPKLSPDGRFIAYTSTIGGNTDVFTMPVAGGEPTRLTYHPDLDYARGWSRDGRKVVIASGRETVPRPMGVATFLRYWQIDPEGGMPEAVPLPRVHKASYSSDGTRLAYQEISAEFEVLEAERQSSHWRGYRGGRIQPIRVFNLTDHSETTIPWDESIDSNPMWIGDEIYFLSDRQGVVNLFVYDLHAGTVAQLTDHEDFDIMNASADDQTIVYEQAGLIHRYDLSSRETRPLSITLDDTDFHWAMPARREVGDMVRAVAVAPNEKDVLIEARGDIFLSALGTRTARNLTQSSDAHDRQPIWSPDGQRMAMLSDARGEYELVVVNVDNLDTTETLALPGPGYFSGLTWSPDGSRLLMWDTMLSLWVMDLSDGQAQKIDSEILYDPNRAMEAVWAPDSQWIAYSRSLPNGFRGVFLYSLSGGERVQVSSEQVDTISPTFDPTGRYLYFLTSLDFGLNGSWSDIGSFEAPPTRTLQAAVLSAEDGPPGEDTLNVRRGRLIVEPGDIRERIVTLDVPPGTYSGLTAIAPGVLVYAEKPRRLRTQWRDRSLRLHRHDLIAGESRQLLDDVAEYSLTAQGKLITFRSAHNDAWVVVSSTDGARPKAGDFEPSMLTAQVEPLAEWRNIYREAWRNQRDMFYAPSMHGADWEAIYRKYLPFLTHVRHRDDLSYVLAMVGGELSVGHSSLHGTGDTFKDEAVSVGMLGADFVIEQGLYRISRILRGDIEAGLTGPLAVPGLDIREGDFLLEINGHTLAPPDSIYSLLQGAAGKPTLLRVSSFPSPEGSRVVTITPTANENALRTHEDWVVRNQRLVEEMSDGRLAYVWMSTTAMPGYLEFIRAYYSQQDREGLILDQRYNQGGFFSDRIISELLLPQMGFIANRSGQPWRIPGARIQGPVVMLANESSGSGGDALAAQFKMQDLGPLVGTRTWGGLVGADRAPPVTIDGGGMNVPNAAYFSLDGEWAVENEGVSPDIEVVNDAASMIEGRDRQLERAVAEALAMLPERAPRRAVRPPPAHRVVR